MTYNTNNFYLNILLEKMNKKGGEMRRKRGIEKEQKEQKEENKMTGGGKITIEIINDALKYMGNKGTKIISFKDGIGFNQILKKSTRIPEYIKNHCSYMLDNL